MNNEREKLLNAQCERQLEPWERDQRNFLKKMNNESIVDKCSQPPIMEFEGFILRPFDGWNLWLENPSGEGTTIQKAAFLGTLIKLFDRTF